MTTVMSDAIRVSTAERPSRQQEQPEPGPRVLKAGCALRVGVLSNPCSGGNCKGLAAVHNILSARPHVLHCEVQTPADVGSALVYLARRQLDVLAINGGDGTVQAALTTLFRQRPFEKLPVLALLRAGTASMLARDVGLKQSSVKALEKLLVWAQSRREDALLLQRPVLRVQAPGGPPLYGMFFGAAGIYQGIRFYHSKLHPLGLGGELAPGLILTRFLLSLVRKNNAYVAPVPIRISLDQNPVPPQNFLLVVVSTLERLVLGLHPFWGTESAPLHFTAVRTRPKHLARVLLAMLHGRKPRLAKPEHGYFSHNVRQVELTLAGGFTLDGELYSANGQQGPVRVEEGGQVSFLQF